jgi:fructoselysine-6-P-deglycase FrlB-like protein
MVRLPGVNALALDPRTNEVMTSSFSNLLLAGMQIAQPELLALSLTDIIPNLNRTFVEFDRLAQRLAAKLPARLMVLTSAGLAPLAREATLKVLELTAGRIVAAHETFVGVRHGPMSFLRPDSLVLCVLLRYQEALLRRRSPARAATEKTRTCDRGRGQDIGQRDGARLRAGCGAQSARRIARSIRNCLSAVARVSPKLGVGIGPEHCQLH